MRLLFAGLFVFIGTMGVVAFFEKKGTGEPSVLFIVPIVVIAFFFLFAVAYVLFNTVGRRRSLLSHGASIEEMEANGLLVPEDFRARRAFQLEEFEDEGPHYLIELEDRSVLYLCGQYLYEYEPIDDPPHTVQSRTFPSTEFTLRRHTTTGEIMDIQCRGVVLEPECLAPCFDKMELRKGLLPEDGQIITDKAYDDLKRERMKGESS